VICSIIKLSHPNGSTWRNPSSLDPSSPLSYLSTKQNNGCPEKYSHKLLPPFLQAKFRLICLHRKGEGFSFYKEVALHYQLNQSRWNSSSSQSHYRETEKKKRKKRSELEDRHTKTKIFLSTSACRTQRRLTEAGPLQDTPTRTTARGERGMRENGCSFLERTLLIC